MRSLQLIPAVLGALALFAPALVAPVHAAPGPKPAAVRVTPSGATLRAGDTVSFEAVVVDKAGNVIPGIPITFKSSASSVVSINALGVATAGAVGKASIQVKAKGKSAAVPVYVLEPATGPAPVVAAGLKQVNHILADGEWVYWSEVDTKVTRIRKMRKTGGAIYDLASEPARNNRGISATYVQIQQFGDRLYFSRQEKGFLLHWSIRSVSKSGGPSIQILPNDTSVEPMLANAWKVAAGRVVVALKQPEKINLNANVRLASWDPETTAWTPILSGQFDEGEAHLLAADDTFAYVRGYSLENRITRIMKVALDGSVPAETLLTRDQPETHRAVPGVTDGTNLYFWTGKDEEHRLVSLPVTGGEVTTLLTSGYGTGLTLDGSNLYWAKAETNVVKLPVTGGGAPISVKSGIYGNPTLAGLALDDTSVYVTVIVSKSEIRMLKVGK
ncbi:MAG: hypothetical protein K0Q72_1720 [Armatimonadetes bacterium]|jgi:hypothetical protein|nr:hypothetical protein [Armatimonadota bacterium]